MSGRPEVDGAVEEAKSTRTRVEEGRSGEGTKVKSGASPNGADTDSKIVVSKPSCGGGVARGSIGVVCASTAGRRKMRGRRGRMRGRRGRERMVMTAVMTVVVGWMVKPNEDEGERGDGRGV